MLKRSINIALILVLLITVVGVSTSKVYCAMMSDTMEKSCCENKGKEEGCCKEITETYKLSTDLSSVNASVAVPDITLFVVTFLTTLYNSIVMQEKLYSYSTYSPPRITSDISVLIQVFRI